MRRSILTFLLACLAATFHVQAQADAGLYRAFGEKAGIQTLMTDFVQRLKTDARLAPFFKDTNPKHLAEMLAQQVCQVSGGPCEYEGATMKEAHAGQEIGRADFNALVEVLQQAMDARGIAFSSQNALLARLAPLHREIVTR
jgi:hemoglobin